MRFAYLFTALALTAGAAHAATARWHAAAAAAPRPAAAAPAAAASPPEEPGFLFDALRLPRYKISWLKLMKDVQPTPDWLLHFSELNGEAGEMTPVTIDGKTFRLSFVCKPADCVGHKFEVLFAAEGAQAFGALGAKDEPPAFYGNPGVPEQEALAKALHPVASAAQPKSE